MLLLCFYINVLFVFMKKIRLFLLGLVVAMSGTAKEVSQSEASAVAIRLMQQKDISVESVKSIMPVYNSGVKAYYVINFAPQGWALISADDMSNPLIGYSEKSEYQITRVPDNAKMWLEEYGKQVVENSKLNGIQARGWIETETIEPMAVSVGKIEPIISVYWNQGSPYNKYCPSNSSGTAVVGCVAVSMAQAMSVAQYPERPNGYCAYVSSNFGDVACNYDAEPTYNWSNILSGANGKDDVARLLWHCGVSVKMDYGIDGSGTQNSYIVNALKTYFSYPNSVTYYSRDAINSNTTWKDLILTELSEGRAICYSGADLTKGYGHAFNLDGYDGSAYFHINWGWGGYGDGWFTIDNLQDSQIGANYTAQHGMVIGIRAPSENPTDITLSNTSVSENQPTGTIVGEVTVVSEASNPSYTYKVQGKKTLFGYAKVPFEVVDGNLVTTEVISASDYADSVTGATSCSVTIIATNTVSGASVSRTFTIEIKPSAGIDDVIYNDNSPAEYYNLHGVRINNTDLTPGIYVKRQGNKFSKVLINANI